MGRITDTVKVLLIVNVLFFIGALSMGDVAYNLFAMHFPLNDKFYPWQIVTHMFMHDMGGFGHIFFNMLMLYMFGSSLERAVGQGKFLFLYFSAGLGATALALLFQYIDFYPGYTALLELGNSKEEVLGWLNAGEYPTNVLNEVPKETIETMFGGFYSSAVGASGAIMGVLAAFAVLYPNVKLMLIIPPIPVKAKYLIGGYFALNVISAVSGVAIIGAANTGFWAHIGGGIIGFIVMWYWKKNSFNNTRLS